MITLPIERTPPLRHSGFSLLELAIVLIVFALLAGGLLTSLGTYKEAAARQAAQQQLENAREALLAYAIAHGRLPCPADPSASGGQAIGTEDRPDEVSNCTRDRGTLPWVPLGLPETDPWGRRLTYYAAPPFTRPVTGEAHAAFTLDSTGNASIRDKQEATYDQASGLAAVIVIHGMNGHGTFLPNGEPLGAAQGDEGENSDGDTIFVAHLPTDDFDDLLTWIPADVLKLKLSSVGKLP